MEKFLQALPKPTAVTSRPVKLSESFFDMAARVVDRPGTVLLASGGTGDCARHHLLAVSPWLTIRAKNNTVSLQTDTRSATFNLPPLTALKAILTRYHIPDPGLPVPVAAGLFGYLSYDLKDGLESLPRTTIDDLGLPDLYLAAPRLILVHDRQTGETRACAPDLPGQNNDAVTDLLRSIQSAPAKAAGYRIGRPVSNFMAAEYHQAVAKIIDYIAAGDVYQVNLSQRFAADFSGDPFRLFSDLFRQNPAPFFAYIHAGDHHIVSTSPERFVKQNGRHIETRPIKGTRPRGKTVDEDERHKQALLSSLKDEAELSMIVDLLRNDLGRVCRGGSVRVAEHKRLEAYDNVFHLVSIVEGALPEGTDSADIIAATFPGGSITGCPKIRAMEIIDELEPRRRHIYTGSIGYIGFHDVMDLSIAIRTAVIRDRRIYYAAGGGIVYDSDPADEHRETLAKAATLLALTDTQPADDGPRRYCWINGRLSSEETVPLPLDSPGWQYGTGLFETIRVDHGRPKFLAEHLERLDLSWRALFSLPAPDITWAAVVDQVLKENRLTEGPAAVKIMAALGGRPTPPYDHTLVVTARPYRHRLDGLGKSGLDLAVYPHPRLIPTADHKTMNYLYYYLAGQWAAARGRDEALIMNPDQTVSETNTANILLIDRRTVTVPRSFAALPGITQKLTLEFLSDRGYAIRPAAIGLEDCFTAAEMLLTNALMGAVPVLSIDGRSTGAPSNLCQDINGYLGMNR